MPKGAYNSVTAHVNQRLCFFATLIEKFPALIEKSQKILNPKLKDKCLFLYLHGHKLANLEHEIQRNVFSRRCIYNFFAFEYSPVPEVSTVKLMLYM